MLVEPFYCRNASKQLKILAFDSEVPLLGLRRDAQTSLQLQRYKRKQEYPECWFVQNNRSVFTMKSFSIWDKAWSYYLSRLNLPQFWIKDYVVTPNQQKQLFLAFLSKVNNESGISS